MKLRKASKLENIKWSFPKWFTLFLSFGTFESDIKTVVN
jgi:hypothetical protein